MKTQNQYTRRAKRVRHTLRRGSNRPRLSVFRSDAHIWAQIIDDTKHTTIAASSDIKLKGTKTERATAVGSAIAKLSIKAGVKSIVFDRGSYRYHGRIKALAEAAREAGLQF